MSAQPRSVLTAAEAMNFAEKLRALDDEAFGRMVKMRWPAPLRRILDDMFEARLTIIAQTLDILRSCP